MVSHKKNPDFLLVNLFGLPIRGLFFWRETIWTHVLTQISEKTDFKRQHTTLIHTIACLDLYRAQTTTHTHLDHTRHLLMLHYLLSDDCADWNQFCKKKFEVFENLRRSERLKEVCVVMWWCRWYTMYKHEIWPEVKCFLINVICVYVSDMYVISWIISYSKELYIQLEYLRVSITHAFEFTLCNFGTFYLFRNTIIDATQKINKSASFI